MSLPISDAIGRAASDENSRTAADHAVLIIILIMPLLLMVSGCTRNADTGAQLYTDQYKSDLRRLAISDPSMYETCKLGNCWCMACKNGTNLFLPMTSLIGGNCYFEKDCNQQRSTELSSLKASPSVQMHEFLLGQGPTIADFAAAQPYCSNRMGMAVQWLVGSKNAPYTLPSAERSMCLLGVNVIPVYVMYSNGENIDSERALNISRILGEDGKNVFEGRLTTDGHVGPVIVVTEMDFNESQAGEVAAEVAAVNEGCHNVRSPDATKNVVNCLVAVAPKINDTKALDAVLELAGSDSIDLVAFGVNGHYVHTCDANAILMQVYNFAGYSLYNKSKPTIIPYVMFEPAGKDADNSCDWDEQKADNAYAAIFNANTIPPLRSRGVIGISPYAFNSTSPDISNPLGCVDCGIAKTESRLNSWYGTCQKYTSKINATTGKPYGIPGLSITFADQPGGGCVQNFQNFNGAYAFNTQYSDATGNKDFGSPQSPKLRDPEKELYACSDCINQSANAPAQFKFITIPGKPPESNCTALPEIDRWASMRNLDPMFVRAIAYTESHLDPCAAAKVCSSQCLGDASCSQGCFGKDFSGNSECYSKGYDLMSDPRSKTSSEFCEFNNAGAGTDNRPIDWKWCGLGLMQSIEPPYTFWPDNYLPPGSTPGVDNPYKDVFLKSGFGKPLPGTDDDYFPQLVTAQACDQKFNPFDPGDSLCMGTLKLELMVHQGYAWIEKYSDALGFSDTGKDTEKAKVFAYYIAANMYTGFWGSRQRDPGGASAFPGCDSNMKNGECWTTSFGASRKVDEAYCNGQSDSYQCKNGKPNWNPPFYCYGATDFVDFVRQCWDPFDYRNDPGANKTSTYYWFSNGCANSFCPYGKALLADINQQSVVQPMPLSGNPYILDQAVKPQ